MLPGQKKKKPEQFSCVVHSTKAASLNAYENMVYSLVPSYVLDFEDFLFLFIEDRNVASIIFIIEIPEVHGPAVEYCISQVSSENSAQYSS